MPCLHGRQRLLRRRLPPRQRLLAKSPRRRTVDRGPDVVPWPVAAACRAAVAVDMLMGAGVPAVKGEVDAAAEGHRVVDDDDLLMMHRTERMGAVDGEMHSLTADLVHQRYRGKPVPEAIESREQTQIDFSR